jgi:dTDP-4-dehydrorhamnose 3,5-epimerase
MSSLLDAFVKAAPTTPPDRIRANMIPDPIEGCAAVPLGQAEDHRGSLIELLTTRDEAIAPIVHVYQVHAGPRSVRAWVFHKLQSDRLCFTTGRFRVVLYDAREGSPTAGRLNELVVGGDNPVLLTIPPFVIHGVQNLEDTTSTFVNLPTRAYHHADPDKYRLPARSPLVPYAFSE